MEAQQDHRLRLTPTTRNFLNIQPATSVTVAPLDATTDSAGVDNSGDAAVPAIIDDNAPVDVLQALLELQPQLRRPQTGKSRGSPRGKQVPHRPTTAKSGQTRPATGTQARPRPSTTMSMYQRPVTGTAAHQRPVTGRAAHQRPATGSHQRPATDPHQRSATGPHQRPATSSTSHRRRTQAQQSAPRPPGATKQAVRRSPRVAPSAFRSTGRGDVRRARETAPQDWKHGLRQSGRRRSLPRRGRRRSSTRRGSIDAELLARELRLLEQDAMRDGLAGLQAITDRVSAALTSYDTFTQKTDETLQREVFGRDPADGAAMASLSVAAYGEGEDGDEERQRVRAAERKMAAERVQKLADETKALLAHLTETESTQAKTLEATLDRLRHIPPIETDILNHAHMPLSPRGTERVHVMQTPGAAHPGEQEGAAVVLLPSGPATGGNSTVGETGEVAAKSTLRRLLTAAQKEKGHTTEALQSLCTRTLQELSRLQAQLQENRVELANQRKERATLEGHIRDLRNAVDRSDRQLAVKSMKLARSDMEGKKRIMKISLLEKRIESMRKQIETLRKEKDAAAETARQMAAVAYVPEAAATGIEGTPLVKSLRQQLAEVREQLERSNKLARAAEQSAAIKATAATKARKEQEQAEWNYKDLRKTHLEWLGKHQAALDKEVANVGVQTDRWRRLPHVHCGIGRRPSMSAASGVSEDDAASKHTLLSPTRTQVSAGEASSVSSPRSRRRDSVDSGDVSDMTADVFRRQRRTVLRLKNRNHELETQVKQQQAEIDRLSRALASEREELRARQAQHDNAYVEAVQRVAADWSEAYAAIKAMKHGERNVAVTLAVRKQEIAKLEHAEEKATRDHRAKQLEAVRVRSAMKAAAERAKNPHIKRPKQRALKDQCKRLAAKEARLLAAATKAEMRLELLRETKIAMSKVLSPTGWAAECFLLRRQLFATKHAMSALAARAHQGFDVAEECATVVTAVESMDVTEGDISAAMSATGNTGVADDVALLLEKPQRSPAGRRGSRSPGRRRGSSTRLTSPLSPSRRSRRSSAGVTRTPPGTGSPAGRRGSSTSRPRRSSSPSAPESPHRHPRTSTPVAPFPDPVSPTRTSAGQGRQLDATAATSPATALPSSRTADWRQRQASIGQRLTEIRVAVQRSSEETKAIAQSTRREEEEEEGEVKVKGNEEVEAKVKSSGEVEATVKSSGEVEATVKSSGEAGEVKVQGSEEVDAKVKASSERRDDASHVDESDSRAGGATASKRAELRVGPGTIAAQPPDGGGEKEQQRSDDQVPTPWQLRYASLEAPPPPASPPISITADAAAVKAQRTPRVVTPFAPPSDMREEEKLSTEPSYGTAATEPSQGQAAESVKHAPLQTTDGALPKVSADETKSAVQGVTDRRRDAGAERRDVSSPVTPHVTSLVSQDLRTRADSSTARRTHAPISLHSHLTASPSTMAVQGTASRPRSLSPGRGRRTTRQHGQQRSWSPSRRQEHSLSPPRQRRRRSSPPRRSSPSRQRMTPFQEYHLRQELDKRARLLAPTAADAAATRQYASRSAVRDPRDPVLLLHALMSHAGEEGAAAISAMLADMLRQQQERHLQQQQQLDQQQRREQLHVRAHHQGGTTTTMGGDADAWVSTPAFLPTGGRVVDAALHPTQHFAVVDDSFSEAVMLRRTGSPVPVPLPSSPPPRNQDEADEETPKPLPPGLGSGGSVGGLVAAIAAARRGEQGEAAVATKEHHMDDDGSRRSTRVHHELGPQLRREFERTSSRLSMTAPHDSEPATQTS